MTAVEPGRLPVPPLSPSPEAEPFWDGCRQHRLMLPYCPACRQFFFYPRALCPGCGSRDVSWRQSAGRGELCTFCVQYQSRLPGFADAAPFVTAIVALAEGPRLMTFLTGVPPDPAAIRCGMPVEVVFEDLPDGNVLPVFRPAHAGD